MSELPHESRVTLHCWNLAMLTVAAVAHVRLFQLQDLPPDWNSLPRAVVFVGVYMAVGILIALAFVFRRTNRPVALERFGVTRPEAVLILGIPVIAVWVAPRVSPNWQEEFHAIFGGATAVLVASLAYIETKLLLTSKGAAPPVSHR